MKVYLPLKVDKVVQKIKDRVSAIGDKRVRCYELDDDRMVVKVKYLGESKLVFRVRGQKDGGTKIKLLREEINPLHAKHIPGVYDYMETVVEDLGGWVI